MIPGTSIRYRENQYVTKLTAMDAAHLTNPATGGVTLASVFQGPDREIYTKCLSVCGGTETTDAWQVRLESSKMAHGKGNTEETFISDRQPGLVGVIEALQPNVKIGA